MKRSKGYTMGEGGTFSKRERHRMTGQIDVSSGTIGKRDVVEEYKPRVSYYMSKEAGDFHYGEAFYMTDRVMTVSFHKYNGDFFPGTGAIDETGSDMGKHHTINVPLKDGINDHEYVGLFKSVIDHVIKAFRPSVIVMQCGADSLGLDRLGLFNLSISAHGSCVRAIKKYNIPLIVVGGGGYTVKNVARCWTYETGLLCGVELPNKLPSNIYRESFAPDYSLHPELSGKVANENTKQYLEAVRTNVIEQLRYLKGAPSVQMQEIPPDIQGFLDDHNDYYDDLESDTNKEGKMDRTIRRANYAEYYEDDFDNDGEGGGIELEV
ncbi:Histone deacetylase phd1 [Zancudomyces culisetae]|uniref:Histone deacetylase phd1 n=1 Tax=Zancudomyces culisetae TaxID=1213189 RepID=A0A1R1PG81_ZANCU|nr:Histone deacetylase phd1 [Zancudomyces culisetae]|eukprot:OMH79990.1 Histone deacetylase phd1 [Zancudomyces culisetae]